MNWLDDYIAENETGYFVSSDGSCWVTTPDGYVRLAIGEGEPNQLMAITRDGFIGILLNTEKETIICRK